jgi:hypothetical protein
MIVNIVELKESHTNADWDKVQVMKYGEIRILSTGQHSEKHFCGIDLKTGSYSNSFLKSYYYPAPVGEKITVEFQND